nr:transcription regulator [uncultured Mediterranean phage uvMED]BAR31601.1 transcription regulator [uncultured Mediterranean phage uvMED]
MKRPYKSYVKSDEENAVNKIIGQRVKQARLNHTTYEKYFDKETKNVWNKPVKKPITQSKLAKKLNISFQQVGKYEKGENGLNAIRILQISNILNLPISYLLENIELLGDRLPNNNSLNESYKMPQTILTKSSELG